MINSEYLYDWLFHYNHYKKLWSAFRREDSNAYFNGELQDVLSAKKQSLLVEIILKTKGDVELIRKYVKDEWE
jgi:hypothetical protein